MRSCVLRSFVLGGGAALFVSVTLLALLLLLVAASKETGCLWDSGRQLYGQTAEHCEAGLENGRDKDGMGMAREKPRQRPLFVPKILVVVNVDKVVVKARVGKIMLVAKSNVR